jgi:hypothetical protein
MCAFSVQYIQLIISWPSRAYCLTPYLTPYGFFSGSVDRLHRLYLRVHVGMHIGLNREGRFGVTDQLTEGFYVYTGANGVRGEAVPQGVNTLCRSPAFSRLSLSVRRRFAESFGVPIVVQNT